jgi:hypothetical protein
MSGAHRESTRIPAGDIARSIIRTRHKLSKKMLEEFEVISGRIANVIHRRSRPLAVPACGGEEKRHDITRPCELPEFHCEKGCESHNWSLFQSHFLTGSCQSLHIDSLCKTPS